MCIPVVIRTWLQRSLLIPVNDLPAIYRQPSHDCSIINTAPSAPCTYLCPYVHVGIFVPTDVDVTNTKRVPCDYEASEVGMYDCDERRLQISRLNLYGR